MSITRKALLITNPGEVGAENYCKGVYVDAENYKRHLASAVGGVWDASDIKHLDRPSAADVRDWVRYFSSSDYVLIMFSGHGWYSSADRDRILELRRGENIASLDLIQGAKKRTVILDCCQKVHPESIMEKRSRLMSFSNEASMARTPNPAICKQLFLEGIRRAEPGIVKMTSCAITEVSTDDETRGGRYNGSIFECISDWVSVQRNIQTNHHVDSFSVVAAHECAAEKTRRLSANQQNPVIEKPRTMPYFPMAVFG